MKKVLISLLVPVIFLQCTNELSEIQTVVGDNSSNSSTIPEVADIPHNAYKATYFNSRGNKTSITERNENSIEHKFQKNESSNMFNKTTSAFWVGDFDFDGGDYEISVQADKNVTVLVDDKYVFDGIGNVSRRISYNTFKALNGVQRVLVFYNMDKSQIAEMILEYYSEKNTKEKILESANSLKPSKIKSDFATTDLITEKLLPHVIVQWRLHSN